MYGLARWHGRYRWLVDSVSRNRVRENLRTVPNLASSEADIARFTRLFFEHKQLRVLLIYLFPHLAPRVVERLWPIEGLHHFDRALQGKKGALLLLSHMNSIMGFVAKDMLIGRGYDIRVAFPVERQPFRPTRFRRFVDRVRQRPPGPPNRDFYAQFNIRPIMRALAEGATVALTGDGWHSAGVTRVPFLGREVYFTTGAAGISRAAGCPIVPVFVAGTAPDRLRVVIEEPLWPEKTADADHDLRVTVTRYVERLEHYLREAPLAWEHWLEPQALDTMATMLDRSLRDRYRI
jgi:lauroyl/myristoyl acyltransferase